jgi:hypothetical protein
MRGVVVAGDDVDMMMQLVVGCCCYHCLIMEEAGRYFRLRNLLHAGNVAALKRAEEGHTSNYPRAGDDEDCCENLYLDY